MTLKTFKLSKFSTKKGLNRLPGECDVLKNLTPMRVEGSEVTRYGYSSAGLPGVPSVGGNAVVPDFWQYVSTENPSAKEVLFLFSHDSVTTTTQYVHVYSTISYGTSTWVDGWVLLNESITLTYTGISGVIDTTFVGAGAGISAVDDYYNGWIAYNSAAPGLKHVSISDYVGSTNTFTTVETVGSDYANWGATGTVILYRGFHAETAAALTVSPLFTNPHVLVGSDGLFRIILGKNSSVQAKPIIFGYINNVIDGITIPGPSFTYKGTYVSRREILAPPSDIFNAVAFQAATGTDNDLDGEKTYHVGVCAIYGGYQRSPLTLFPQASITAGTTGGYINAAATTLELGIRLSHYAGKSDKRITAYEIYVAQDEGDTSARTRAINPYYFVRRFELKKIDNQSNFAISGTGSNNYYLLAIHELDLTSWESRGSSWEDMSGYIRGVDTMYSADLEITTPTRQWMARTYKYTDAREDLDSIYTNPATGDDGQIQIDIFPDQPDVYSKRVKYGDSSVIDGILPFERENVFVLKDMSITKISVTEQTDRSIITSPESVSDRIGCVSPIYGYVETPYGIYFVGKDDIYLYDNQGLKALTVDDWQGDYRAIAYATKQAAIVWYRPEEEAIYCKLGSDVYAYFMRYQAWRQVAYADALAGYTVKADGTFVWWKTGGTAYKFDTSTTDAGTAITVNVDTGWFRITPTDESARIHRAFLNQNQSTNAPTATLYMSYEGSSTSVTPTLTTGKRVALGIPVTTRSWCDLMKIVYQTTGLVELGEIEIHGVPYKKTKAA